MNLAGSVLVTGGASGIGRATAERFLAAGWGVLVAGFNAATGETVMAELSERKRGGGGQVDFIRTDVAREADVEAAVGRAVDRFGRIDCVVNNAGVGGAFGPITEIDVGEWDYTF